MNPLTSDTKIANADSAISESVNLGGRPTKYDPRLNDLVFKFCLLGATDRQIADFIGVTETTINNWKIEHPLFFESIQRGKLQADANVANALYHRALGYSHEAVKIFQFDGETLEHKYTEHYPPDTAAAFIWLKNRRPKQWRDRSEVTNIHKLDPREMSPEMLKELADEHLRQALGTEDPAAIEAARKQLEAVEVTAEVVQNAVETAEKQDGAADGI
jgi:hypothetical protein